MLSSNCAGVVTANQNDELKFLHFSHVVGTLQYECINKRCQKDRHDEAKTRFSQLFYERAYKGKRLELLTRHFVKTEHLLRNLSTGAIEYGGMS